MMMAGCCLEKLFTRSWTKNMHVIAQLKQCVRQQTYADRLRPANVLWLSPSFPQDLHAVVWNDSALPPHQDSKPPSGVGEPVAHSLSLLGILEDRTLRRVNQVTFSKL